MGVSNDNKLIQIKVSKTLDTVLQKITDISSISKSAYCSVAILEKILRDFDNANINDQLEELILNEIK